MKPQKPVENLSVKSVMDEKEEEKVVITSIDKKEQAKRYASEHPEVAAELINVWMKDE